MDDDYFGRPEKFFGLFSSLTNLKGVGPRTTKSFEKLGVRRFKDLLLLAPTDGITRVEFDSLNRTKLQSIVIVEVKVLTVSQKSRRSPVIAIVEHASYALELIFFNLRLEWIKKMLPENQTRVVSGKIDSLIPHIKIVNPDYIVFPDERYKIPSFQPKYPLSKGISQKMMLSALKHSLTKVPPMAEWLDERIVKEKKWPTFPVALKSVHNPSCSGELSYESVGRQRLAFDEFYAHQISLALARSKFRRLPGISIKGSGAIVNKLIKALPFELTKCQSEAVKEIESDMQSNYRMNRLLQGDVGSGKTLVALIAILRAIETGGQAALLAPTEILAIQHFETIVLLTKSLGLRIVHLSGRDKGAFKEMKITQIKSGDAQLIIGTHALFQEKVQYSNLILAVIDEQHRFGVEQRVSFVEKGGSADLLLMSATPIPRSLVLTYYGDMSISVIKKKPKNRLPVKTAVIPQRRLSDLLNRLELSLNKKQRVFWVCPVIEGKETNKFTSAESRFNLLKERFKNKMIGLVHGRMTSDEKERLMKDFAKGSLDLLVSTTVIEVGVDVPEASIMIIEGAERFGLAQLHQLRGRVGRGRTASSCILLYSDNIGLDSQKRLDVLRKTDDGFKISKEDLKIRGYGDILGVQQSGVPKFHFGDLDRHSDLVEVARKNAQTLVGQDPNLSSIKGKAVKDLLYFMELENSFEYIKA